MLKKLTIVYIILAAVTCSNSTPPPKHNPILNVEPDSLIFDDQNRSGQIFISNNGEGDMQWRISYTSDWLKANPYTGSVNTAATDTVLISVDERSYPTEELYGRIIIKYLTYDGNDQSDTVFTRYIPTIKVGDLGVTPDTVRLLADSIETADIFISNIGDNTIGWYIEEQFEWLFFTATAGDLIAGASARVTLRLNNAKITTDTTANLVIRCIHCSVGNVFKTIHIIVKGKAQIQPILDVKPDTIVLNEQRLEDYIYISSKSSAGFTYSINTDKEWLITRPTAGIVAPGTPSQVIVQATNLAATTQFAEISVWCQECQGATYDRVFVVAEASTEAKPNMILSKSSINLGDKGVSTTFNITNNGNTDLAWRIDSFTDPDWFDILMPNGSKVSYQPIQAGKSLTLTLKATRSGVDAGLYRTNLNFVNVSHPNNTINLSVEVEVLVKLSSQLTELTFDPIACDIYTEQYIYISNSHLDDDNNKLGSMNWAVTRKPDWLTVTPTQGKITDRETDTLFVIINLTNINSLQEKKYTNDFFTITPAYKSQNVVTVNTKIYRELHPFSINPDTMTIVHRKGEFFRVPFQLTNRNNVTTLVYWQFVENITFIKLKTGTRDTEWPIRLDVGETNSNLVIQKEVNAEPGLYHLRFWEPDHECARTLKIRILPEPSQ